MTLLIGGNSLAANFEADFTSPRFEMSQAYTTTFTPCAMNLSSAFFASGFEAPDLERKTEFRAPWWIIHCAIERPTLSINRPTSQETSKSHLHYHGIFHVLWLYMYQALASFILSDLPVHCIPLRSPHGTESRVPVRSVCLIIADRSQATSVWVAHAY
jgi:hypothetical protein